MKKEELEKIIQAEGNHYEFQSKGLKCVIHRNSVKAWCGYVGIDKEHKLYGKDYNEKEVSEINVHGGLTYSDKAYWNKIDNKWYFGFDCVHCGDLSIVDFAFPDIPPCEGTEYRDKEYVISECEKLAEQLINLNN